MYHYAGNNPVRYTDPTGAFTVDNENQTIICDLNDKNDVIAAARAFFVLQDEGFSCIAYDSKTNKRITFNHAKGMYSFIDNTYNNYLNGDSFNFTEFLSDTISFTTATAEKGTIASDLNKFVSIITIYSDGKKLVKNISQGNTFGAIDSSVDLLIDGVGFTGPAGGYISIGLKYTKRGVIFGITQFARGQIELEKYEVNKWSESMFGVRFK